MLHLLIHSLSYTDFKIACCIMLNTWLYIVVNYVLLNDILALLVATFYFLQYMYNETFIFDIHGSVHHNTVFIKMTNKMQLCRIIYYCIVPWLLYMFGAILSFFSRSVLTVITASGFIHMYCCRLLSWLSRE